MTATVTDINTARSPLSYALAYIRLGLWVLPLEPGTKKPLGKLVRNGFHDATNDPDVVTRWWTQHPDAGLGIAVKKSGWVVVDIDPRNGGIETIDALEAKHGPLQSDVLAYTGGGGEHRVFAAQLVEALPGKLGDGVDLKADGYIAVEPTLHPSGRAYAWEASSDPLDGVVPTTLPGWIRDLGRHAPAAGTYTPPAVQPIAPQRLASAREALAAIASDDRETWVKVGAAIHNEMPGQEGFDLWSAWSQGSPKFDPQDQIRVWRSFKVRGLAGVGLNTVFAMAQAEGWKNTGGVVAQDPLPTGLAPLDLTDLAKREAEPIAFLVDKWLPAKAVTVLTAHGGVGKSTMSLQLAVCIATGAPWFGITTQRSRVLLVSCEDARQAIHWRLSHVCRYMGVDMASLKGWLTIFDLTEHDCVMWARGQATERMKWLVAMVEEHKSRCVILDNASDTYADNENDRTAVRAFVRTLARIAIAIDGSVLLLAHVDKASARGVVESSDSYSGSTAWNNSARSRWAMLRNKDRTIQIANEKNNYAARQDPFTVEYDATRLVFVTPDEGGSAAATELILNSARLSIMRAIGQANSKGARISAAPSAPQNNAYKILPDYGLSAIPRDQFWQCVAQLVQWKFVEEREYLKANKQPAKELFLTDAGHARCTQGSGAGPLWR